MEECMQCSEESESLNDDLCPKCWPDFQPFENKEEMSEMLWEHHHCIRKLDNGQTLDRDSLADVLIQKLTATVGDFQKSQENSMAALSQIEFIQPIPVDFPYCPACGNGRDHGHMASCLTGLALGTSPPIPDGATVLIPAAPAPIKD